MQLISVCVCLFVFVCNIYKYIHTCVCVYMCVYTYIHTYIHLDVLVAEWLAWLTSNCVRIGAIGTSPSNGLNPNL